MKSEKTTKQEALPPITKNSIHVTRKPESPPRKDDSDSDAESVGRKSVYYVDGENEWASLVKYDSELYKRELELTKLRE